MSQLMSQAKWRGNRYQISEMIRTHVGSLDSAIFFWTFGGPWLTEEISMVSLLKPCMPLGQVGISRRVNQSPGVLLDVQREHHPLQHVVKHLRRCQQTACWCCGCILQNLSFVPLKISSKFTKLDIHNISSRHLYWCFFPTGFVLYIAAEW